MEAVVLLVSMIAHVCLCARILGVSPAPSFSHQVPFLVIMRTLAERGHNVTIVTTDPMKDPPPNTTQIDFSFMYDKWKRDIDFVKLSQLSTQDFADFIVEVAASDCDAQLKNPEMKELVRSGAKFDLVILEFFAHWCHIGLVRKLGSPPLAGIWSAEAFPHHHRVMGNPMNPAYFPELSTAYSDHMTFWERAHNAYETLQSLRTVDKSIIIQDRVLREHFENDLPSISEIQYNVSLLLVNNNFNTGYSKPMEPTVIQMTGLHIKTTREPLSKNIQHFLDGATHGVIYFSLGSNVKSNSLPESMRQVLLEAFAELPQRVLWKWEEDSLPGKPSNVMIAKWLAQQHVLAHPNIRLFITQGGLLSFNEAAYFGIPLIGVPFFGDQPYNVAKMVSAGIAVKLSFQDITKASVLQAVRTVLDNPSYQENMKRFSAIYREHQGTSLENVIWWLEYVLRHKGAPQLHSAALDLRWWQLLLLDVVAFVLLAAAVTVFLLYKLARWLLAFTPLATKIKKQ